MWEKLYGKRDVTQNYDLREDGPNKEFIDLFAKNMREEIVKRMDAPYTNIIAVPWGGVQRRAVEDLPQLVVETGIGYPYSWAKYRVYESYAWLHNRMGKEGVTGDNWYSCVIPNGRDPEAYGPVVPTDKKQNYFLMVCRLNEDKGIRIAMQVCEKLGVPLKLCGQGNPAAFSGPGVTYMKPRGMEELRDTIRYAKGLFSLTRYVEPFGTIHMEALMSGTPVITTDFGVYSETVPHGLVGFRGRTMGHFLWAARNIDKIDPYVCREWAVNNYSLDKCKPMYHDFFQSLLKLNTKEGWNDSEDGRGNLDFLKKDFSMFAPKV
jgi:glycosyltransferase involved in cell wall biosynthesis